MNTSVGKSHRGGKILTHPHSQTFTGFSPKTLEFLQRLSENNNKVWFDTHRQTYEDDVLKPFKNLVSNLAGFMLGIDPYLEVTPAVNKTISRIYRDTRFSKDKSPFRSNMWIVFKRPRKDWQDAPGYFFEIFPDWYRYGMGFYRASRQTMDRFRQSIDEHTDAFLSVIKPFYKKGTFELKDETFKRPLPSQHSEMIQDWYQRKTFYLSCDRPIDERLFSPGLEDDLIQGFTQLAPLYGYLWKIRSDA